MFQLVELIVGPSGVAPAANSSTYLQQQPQLQSYLNGNVVYVKAIETFSDQAITTSPLTSGNPVATAADIAAATLTLVVKGWESIKQVPLAMLNRMYSDTGAGFVPFNQTQLFLLKDVFEIDWGKSYVTTQTAGATVPFSFLFGVHYSYEPDQEFVIPAQ